MKLVSVRPSKRAITLAIFTFVSALVLPYWFEQVSIASTTNLVLIFGFCLFLILDFLISKKPPPIAINREAQSILSLYQETKIKFGIANRSSEKIELDWIEKIPNDWQGSKHSQSISLVADESQEYEYLVKPQKRGRAIIEGVYLRLMSSWGLLQLTWFRDNPSEYKVYPNFKGISDVTGLNGSINILQSGLKKFNLRGAGMDFLQLRDYREGESLRQIDWRASSRFNKLISKEFQEEKNQHVMIMLDAGRRMRVQDDDLSYFEHALNALIMLSFTALKNGDSVSIQSFGSESRWLSHVRGVQNVNRVLHHFYDLYPEKISSDYLGAAQELIVKQAKRSLVLLVTCLRDEDFEDLLLSINILQDKHLVAVVSIEEPIYKEIESAPVKDFESALNYASSNIIKRSIDANIKRLKHQGVICIQTRASGLSASVINSYLSIKKAGLL